ncbi:MAG: LytR C-terminal domain-containing protein, partial [Gaiellaceae bacterium]
AAIAKGQQAAGPEAKGTPAKQLLSRAETSVIVLNGNGIAGAAGAVAERARARRYVIAATGNAPRSDFPRSLVMYRPGFEGEAQRLARDLGIKRVAPLDGVRASELQGAHLALIVGG